MTRYLSLLAIGLFALPLAAQNTDLEALGGLTFNFRNPGARSLAMGGAFLGLADDATAAEANPAGLTILRVPEVSLELRHSRTDTVMNASGDYPDLSRDIFFTHSDAAEVSFASVVLPADRWALAAYYHQPLKIESEINMAWEFNLLNQAVLRDLPFVFIPRGNPVGSALPVSRQRCIELQLEDIGACSGFQQTPFYSLVEMKQETFGLAAAVQFGRLSLGAGARYQTFSQAALTIRFDDFLTPIEALIQATELDEEGNAKEENDTTFTAGFKYAFTDSFSIGGVYKQGAEFPTAVFQAVAFGDEFEEEAFPTTFHVPDTAGIGFAWRPLPALTLLGDAVFIRYSNLTDDFRSAYGEIQILDQPYQIEDSTEYHFGAEYFIASRIPVAIRAGWWREPGHGLEYVGPLTCTDPQIAEPDRVLCAANRVRSATIFPGSKDEDHYTVGIGLSWPNFSIDAAYDTADSFKVGSLSAVVRF
jgi:long-chain fatty acid transport protein